MWLHKKKKELSGQKNERENKFPSIVVHISDKTVARFKKSFVMMENRSVVGVKQCTNPDAVLKM